MKMNIKDKSIAPLASFARKKTKKKMKYKITFTKQEAIEYFTKIFIDPSDKTDSGSSFNFNGGNFLISKSKFSREEVVARLLEFDRDYKIEDHCIEVAPLTVVYTIFKIIPIIDLDLSIPFVMPTTENS